MGAYYNEIEPYAAQWLRNLIADGHIAPGDVDERDIRDVRPDDLRGYTQCHFFAGIGVWSLALRRAGWADDRPVWTGSCPCQPFSAAGAGLGFADERHLWPFWYHLISECRPPVVLGEQVASKDADPWVDLVHDDMEAVDYAFGTQPFPAAGVGAPHIRDRNYWLGVALGDAKREGLAFGKRLSRVSGGQAGSTAREAIERAGVHTMRLADTGRRRIHTEGPGQIARASSGVQGQSGQRQWLRLDVGAGSAVAGGLADANRDGCESRGSTASPARHGNSTGATGRDDRHVAAGPINGLWRAADWLLCRDGKWRPVEPGTQPLAHGASARVGRLRAYGNAITAEAARVFIEEVMECLP